MGRDLYLSSVSLHRPINVQHVAERDGSFSGGFKFSDRLCLSNSKEGKIYASELLLDMENYANTEMEEQIKVAQTHHFPRKETDRSCETPNDDFTFSHQFSGGDDVFLGTSIGNPLVDGYNWRKYGQKQVRGCNCPRSYYRCTYPFCKAKRKVEHALDGQITEIIYMESHTHPKPLPTKQPALVSTYKLKAKSSDSVVDHGENLKSYFQDMGSSTSDVTKSSQIHANFSALLVGDSCLSTLRSKKDEVVPTGKTLYFGNVNENEFKKRMIDGSPEKIKGSHHICQPKVVLQTFSEVDVLEDGYHWRKYGQKVVKGNPNPRNYYRCTTPRCHVKKHTERSADDVRYVITSYEGTHNHEVPGAKTSNSICSGGNAQFSELNSKTQNASSGSTCAKPAPHNFVHGLSNDSETCSEYPNASSFGASADSELLSLLGYQPMPPLSPPTPLDAFGMGNCFNRDVPLVPMPQLSSPTALDAFGRGNCFNRDVPQVFPMQDLGQQSPNSDSMESDDSEYGSAGHRLSHSWSTVSELRASHGHWTELDTMQTLMNPEKEARAHDTPESTLCY